MAPVRKRGAQRIELIADLLVELTFIVAIQEAVSTGECSLHRVIPDPPPPSDADIIVIITITSRRNRQARIAIIRTVGTNRPLWK